MKIHTQKLFNSNKENIHTLGYIQHTNNLSNDLLLINVNQSYYKLALIQVYLTWESYKNLLHYNLEKTIKRRALEIVEKTSIFSSSDKDELVLLHWKEKEQLILYSITNIHTSTEIITDKRFCKSPQYYKK